MQTWQNGEGTAEDTTAELGKASIPRIMTTRTPGTDAAPRCSLHPAEQTIPGRTIADIALHGTTYAIDLCERCEEELLAPLRRALEAHGRTLVG